MYIGYEIGHFIAHISWTSVICKMGELMLNSLDSTLYVVTLSPEYQTGMMPLCDFINVVRFGSVVNQEDALTPCPIVLRFQQGK